MNTQNLEMNIERLIEQSPIINKIITFIETNQTQNTNNEYNIKQSENF